MNGLPASELLTQVVIQDRAVSHALRLWQQAADCLHKEAIVAKRIGDSVTE